MSIEMLGIILGGGIVTYGTRFPLMVLSSKRDIPPKLTKFMSFIAPAILTSLIAPSIFINKGNVDFSMDNKYLLASILTALSAYYFKNMLLSVLTGICTVAVLMYAL